MILFIDDEKMFNESYVEALEEEGFQVQFEHNIAGGLDFFTSKMGEVNLVILDIMFATPGLMPEGIDKSKIMGGLRTGEELLRLMNATPGGREIPKIILTNVDAEDFHTKYTSSEEVAGCFRKRDTLPSKLAEIVNDILQE